MDELTISNLSIVNDVASLPFEEWKKVLGRLFDQAAEIERLQAELDELDADYAEACMPDEKDV